MMAIRGLKLFAEVIDGPWSDDTFLWIVTDSTLPTLNISTGAEVAEVSAPAFVDASGQADLVVSAIAGAATITQGGNYGVSYVVQNQGTGAAESTSWAAVYFDQQVTPVTNSWSLTNALSAGASQTLGTTLGTGGLSVGAHTLWIKADNFNNSNGQFNSGNNNVVESNENNNWRSIAFNVIAPAPASTQADLVVSSIAAATTVNLGANYNISYAVQNQGAGAAESTSWAAAYIDQQVTPVANSWSLTNALSAGASQTLGTTISTAGLSVGAHTLWIKADNFNSSNGQFNSGLNNVSESDESNNWRSVAFNVTAPALPDLIVSSVGAPASIALGANLDFSYVVQNQGSGAATSTSWAAAYLDQQITPVSGSWSLTNALGAGGSQTISNSISTAGLSVGAHTLWIEADNFNSANGQFNSGNNDVSESNEINNWRSVTFSVTAPTPADLIVSSISAPASVSQGASLGLSYVVTNQGTGSANSTSWAAAYLDQQVTPVSGSWSQTNALGAGAFQTQSASISTAGLSIGTHTLWIEADNFNSSNGQFNSGTNNVAESDEANNWRSVSFDVTAPVDPFNISVNF